MIRIIDQRYDRSRHLLHIQEGNHEAGAVDDRLGCAANSIKGDDGKIGRHRLHADNRIRILA